MKTKSTLLLTRKCTSALLSFLALLALPLIVDKVAAQAPPLILWVFDQGLDDSQFGYYDGAVMQSIEPLYEDADIEGLACLNNVIYASGGRDGQAPSTLNTLVVDTASSRATLTKIADIHTINGEPFFEVVSLSAHADGTLWGYADNPPLRGIIRIDLASAVAELVVPAHLKVEGIAWIDNTLWLAGDHHVYHWAPGGSITFAFDVAGVGQLEALEPIDGLLYAGVNKDDRGVIAIDPATGMIVAGQGFLAPNDIEGVTFCPLQPESVPIPTATNTDTPTATSTETPTAMDTATPTATSTQTPTMTNTTTATELPPGGASTTDTPTPTATSTETPTITPTATRPTAVLPPTGLDPIDEPGASATSTIYLPLVVQ